MSNLALPTGSTSTYTRPAISRGGLALPPNPPPATHTRPAISSGGLALPPNPPPTTHTRPAISSGGLALPPNPRPATVEKQPAAVVRHGLALPSNPRPPQQCTKSRKRAREPETSTSQETTSSQDSDGNANARIERPTKRRKAIDVETFGYRCRHGCPRIFRDAAGMRSHHQKTHNHFAPGTAVEKCGLCGKQFPTQSGLDGHVGRKGVCNPFKKPKGWNVPYPTTQQERIDTWAFSKQGEVSEHLKVYPDENGELPEELPELPTPEMLLRSQSTNVNQQRASDPLTTGIDHNPTAVVNESQQVVGSCQESPILIDDDNEPMQSGGEQLLANVQASLDHHAAPHHGMVFNQQETLRQFAELQRSDYGLMELTLELEAIRITGYTLEQLARLQPTVGWNQALRRMMNLGRM